MGDNKRMWIFTKIKSSRRIKEEKGSYVAYHFVVITIYQYTYTNYASVVNEINFALAEGLHF